MIHRPRHSVLPLAPVASTLAHQLEERISENVEKLLETVL